MDPGYYLLMWKLKPSLQHHTETSETKSTFDISLVLKKDDEVSKQIAFQKFRAAGF